MRTVDGISEGNAYKDGITGFEGTCVGICTYLSGCNQALLVPRVDNKGRHRSGVWFDTSRLVQTELHEDVTLPDRELVASAPGPDMAPSRSY